MAGAMVESPFLDVGESSKLNTENVLSPPNVLERYSKITPKFTRLFSETPVKTSKVDVKNVCLGMSTPVLLLSPVCLVCVYKPLKNLMSHCPLFNRTDGVNTCKLFFSSISSSCENP